MQSPVRMYVAEGSAMTLFGRMCSVMISNPDTISLLYCNVCFVSGANSSWDSRKPSHANLKEASTI